MAWRTNKPSLPVCISLQSSVALSTSYIATIRVSITRQGLEVLVVAWWISYLRFLFFLLSLSLRHSALHLRGPPHAKLEALNTPYRQARRMFSQIPQIRRVTNIHGSKYNQPRTRGSWRGVEDSTSLPCLPSILCRFHCCPAV